ncbi:hypothetical protein, partial [Salmonella enterica]|uniref:hypothetical protein n=1 Tax=Salmonella enterica TaxID=28901 RepID=UPI003D2AF98F
IEGDQQGLGNDGGATGARVMGWHVPRGTLPTTRWMPDRVRHDDAKKGFIAQLPVAGDCTSPLCRRPGSGPRAT